MTNFPFYIQQFEHFVTRASFVQYVKSAYYLGGYEIVKYGPSIDLDPNGFEFLRTLTLRHVKSQYEIRIVLPEDLIEANGGHPKVEQIIGMYGAPVSYERES